MIRYNLVSVGGEGNVTAFIGGEMYTASHEHPNFKTIVEKLAENDESVVDLFDVSRSAARRFDRLSERITVSNGRIYLDGEEVDTALTQQVSRFLGEGVEDWKPLVRFWEKLLANPNEHSREQLYRWLNAHNFTISEDGDIVAYKSVRKTSGGYESITAGNEPVVVNNETFQGHIPNPLGAVVEMPRGTVAFDPTIACSVGLHVATYRYASSWWTGANPVLEVHVNPRDVVSVPTDADDAKMRVCRYTIIKEVEKEYTSPLLASPWEEDDEEDYCYSCEGDWDYCSCGD